MPRILGRLKMMDVKYSERIKRSFHLSMNHAITTHVAYNVPSTDSINFLTVKEND